MYDTNSTYEIQQQDLRQIMAAHEDDNLIVVHTDETKSLLYNPATHEETHSEMADGNIAVTVQPKRVEAQTE